ncbi:MAG: sulfatase, partial [Acidobacteriota bacterium]
LPRRALGGRLVFETHPGPALEAPFARPADAAYDYAAWSQPRYIPPISGDSTQQRPNLLLISIDTLRADHLGTYGYGRDTSPNIDALAAKGVVFEKAIAQAPWTTPSHMSLLTSLWPSTHGVVSTREALAPSIPTLASVLRQEGYGTAAFCGGVTMSGQRGFDHGFDRYRETFTFLDDDETRGVWRWLDERSGEPFFLFLHTFEVHAPYTHPHFVEGEAAQRELAPLLSGVLGQESIQESQRLKRGLQGAGLFDREITEALYDGGIRYTDAWVGEVLAALDARGLRKNTLVVLTSDHGDEFGEHDPLAIYDAHGHSLYDELLHIPWIMAFEGRLPAERRVAEQVRSIDVMPTVLELMGLPEQSGLQGTSLAAPLLSDEPIPSLVAFSEVSGSSPKSGQDLRSMRTQELKYIAVRRWLGDQVETDEELFDLLRDVGELHDLADLEGAVVEDLRRLSEAFFADAERAKVEGGTSLPADDETLRQLRALGYVQ